VKVLNDWEAASIRWLRPVRITEWPRFRNKQLQVIIMRIDSRFVFKSSSNKPLDPTLKALPIAQARVQCCVGSTQADQKIRSRGAIKSLRNEGFVRRSTEHGQRANH